MSVEIEHTSSASIAAHKELGQSLSKRFWEQLGQLQLPKPLLVPPKF